MSRRELRMIAISLSILSLGFAIAYGGLIFFSNKSSKIPGPTATPSITPTKPNQ